MLMLLIWQVTRAEGKITNFMVKHNLPFAVANHLSHLLQDVVPDSQIAKHYLSDSEYREVVGYMSVGWLSLAGP